MHLQYRWDSLHFGKKKYIDEDVFIAVQQHFQICLAVLLGAWPQLMQDNPEQQHCLQHVEQIGDMLSSFTKGINGDMQIYLPTYNKSPQQRGRKNRKRGQRGCEARWTTEINIPPAD